MTPKNQINQLYVYLNDKLTGELERKSTGQLVFTYDEHWLASESASPISLSMPLTEVPYKGDIVENYFDNLLPDNREIRQRIQTRFMTPSLKCFDLLSQTGQDCVGALQLMTSQDFQNVHSIQATPISAKEIATLLKNYRTAPLGMDRENDFRISLAGAQEKTALLFHENQWKIPKGITPTSHIIKQPIGKTKNLAIDLSNSVEIEWLSLKLLSAYGINVNEAKMETFDDTKALVIKRFDRQWASNNSWLTRLQQEDFCQALNFAPGLKYEEDGGPGIKAIMDALAGSANANEDRTTFMKTVFLFWVLGAIDGHAKNFSISIHPGGRYKLTPIYDVISAYPLLEKRQIQLKDMKMAMAVKGKNTHYKWNEIQLRHWLETAKKCRFSESIMQEIIKEAFDRMEAVIEQVSSELPPDFPKDISNAIFNGMRKVKHKT